MKMRKVCTAPMVVMLFLISLALLAPPAAADWHGGRALVLYSERSYWPPSDGWVQHNYKDYKIWNNFSAEFADQGWSVDFAKHVDAANLSNYDALFVLTPNEDIPDDEAQAIINWVLDGGQLVITQDWKGKYANEITEPFGIKFIRGIKGCTFSYINEFGDHPVTAGLTEVNGTVDGITARKINVSGSSKEIGWFSNCIGKHCLLAVNDTAGEGVVVAIGDEWMWSCWRRCCRFNQADNEKLLDNILAYFRQTCSVPEFTPLRLTIPVLGLLGMVLLLLRRA
ncbi:MAG TPA: hypothetical protein ENI32_05500 [Candidatus Syntrophoarchaeum butanivorans]|uniref:DUF4350 domain-containing protein n=1 Tax=Candidatus Syntropharchaeum butanivorans TaxID=1839936 RepID=A0A1F2P6E2_9EURY|nr:MAG: conserved hypothetical protein, membrane [Candidatus Syntrophoarchaeum butanivorans]HEC57319.1 hypothetical protein [Candidatus Syntrophoarchaeum butanivorans]